MRSAKCPRLSRVLPNQPLLENDGMEYEFVQYYSDDVAKRNDYDL